MAKLTLGYGAILGVLVGGHLLSFAIWLGFNSSVFFLFFKVCDVVKAMFSFFNFVFLAKIGDDPQENFS